MNILIWLVLGGLIGWAASARLRMREGIPLNVIVGSSARSSVAGS